MPQRTALTLTEGARIAGRYRLEAELGRGASGVVWRAAREPDGLKVAVKILLPEAAEDPVTLARFEREGSILGELDHPNIVRLFETGREGETRFLIYELVEGRTLESIIEREAPIAPARAGALCAQLLAALEHAHARGIVHRDLKPSNIIVTEASGGATLKVLDFGIAKRVGAAAIAEEGVTMAGQVVGTPHYMSPELIAGDEIDGRADLYAAGLLLHELLTGSHPFERARSSEVIVAHLRDDPAPLDAGLGDTAYAEAIGRALAKQPDDRFESAARMAEVLAAAPPAEPERAARPRRASPRRFARAAALLALPLAAALLLLLLLWQLSSAGGGATLAVSSEPAGARVSVDGARIGRTPISIEMPSDRAQISVRVSAPGRAPSEWTSATDVSASKHVVLAPSRTFD